MRNSATDFKTLLYALKATGCRPKEARTLTWSQVRTDRWILVDHKTAEKTRRPRVIYLTQAMQKLMSVLRLRSKSDHVFLNGRGEAWIEGWYNTRRRHSAINYLSPEAFEARMN